MTNLAEGIAEVVRLNGGELVGRTRLQKTCYFLEALEVGFEVEFDYHNFGPFSPEVALAVDDAQALGLLTSEERSGNYHVPYTVFRATEEAIVYSSSKLVESRSTVLGALKLYSALVLELAATVHFLSENGFGDKCWEETVRRKSLKASGDRLSKSESLIGSLGLKVAKFQVGVA